tara:strand:- start:5174 stop:6424 length:1251 start_codon:yes stop_codon:yes gene_type:complete
MKLFNWLKTSRSPVKAALPDGGVTITTPEQLADYLASGGMTASGAHVTKDSAMQVAAVYRSVAIISGGVANMPLNIKERVSDRVRMDASNHYLWSLLRRKPNSWMTASGFRRLLTMHVILRGNGYAQIVRSRGRVIALNPLNPDRMTVVQLDDLTLAYKYQKANGQIVVLPQESVFHLMLMSMDGITGITPIHYAREAIGLSLQTENHGASLFKNGANASGVLKHPGALTDEALLRLKGNMEQYRGAENANKIMILEGGMDYAQIAMTQEDAQFIETRKFSRTDIAMFLGVPPHMLGDTEKSTSYGTGIEQQSRGFVTFNLQDYLTMWEDTIARDLIDEKDGSIFARFNTGALVRSDIKSRTESQVKRVQFGINTVNEVRAENDENPVDGGDVRYPPPNTNGTEGDGNEPETPTED